MVPLGALLLGLGAAAAGCGPPLEPEAPGQRVQQVQQMALAGGEVPTAEYGEVASTSVGGSTVSDLFQAETFVEVRLNRNAEALTGEVLPLVGDAAGLDSFTLPDRTALSGTLGGAAAALLCHTSSAPWSLQLLDIRVEAPITASTVSADIDAGRKLQMDLDMPAFEAQLTLRYSSPVDVGGVYCNTFGTDHDIRVAVNVNGLDGDFDVTLAEGGPTVRIQSIDRFAVEVDSVSFDSSFLTSLTNLGLGIGHIFGLGCSNLTSCVNDLVSDQLSASSTFRSQIQEAVNDALDRSLDVAGGFNLGAASLDYSVALTEVMTNDPRSRVNTKWSVAFDSDRPDAACAAGLYRSMFTPTGQEGTDDDLDILVPFKQLTDLMYTIAKQGDLCAPFLWNGPSTTHGRTATPGQGATVQVKPKGSFRVTPLSPANRLALRVPVGIEAASTATADIDATLELVVRLEPACGAGLELEVTDVNILDPTGTLSYTTPLGTTVSMTATEYVNNHRAAAEAAILAALQPAVTVLPSTFGLGSVGRWVSTGQIVTDSSSVILGLDLVGSDPNCD